jgi:alanyl-tRNA synthetase
MKGSTLFEQKFYIVADHIRAICFIVSDGILPNPKGRGYILRRLIRRSFSASLAVGVEICESYFRELVEAVIGIYDGVYDEVSQNKDQIVRVLMEEWQKYQKAIHIGQKEWAKILA